MLYGINVLSILEIGEPDLIFICAMIGMFATAVVLLNVGFLEVTILLNVYI